MVIVSFDAYRFSGVETFFFIVSWSVQACTAEAGVLAFARQTK